MRVARCCCTTNVRGPVAAAGDWGGGSGVCAKSRFASYSARLPGASEVVDGVVCSGVGIQESYRGRSRAA